MSFMANFWISECLRGMLFETHSMNALVSVYGSFPGHYLAEGRRGLFLSPPFFAGAILPGPSWKAKL